MARLLGDALQIATAFFLRRGGSVQHTCGHLDGQHGILQIVHHHGHELEPVLLPVGNIAGHVVEGSCQSPQFVIIQNGCLYREIPLAKGLRRTGQAQRRADDPPHQAPGAGRQQQGRAEGSPSIQYVTIASTWRAASIDCSIWPAFSA